MRTPKTATPFVLVGNATVSLLPRRAGGAAAAIAANTEWAAPDAAERAPDPASEPQPTFAPSSLARPRMHLRAGLLLALLAFLLWTVGGVVLALLTLAFGGLGR